MAGIVYTKLIDALKGIGVDVSQQQASNVKKLAPKNKSTATKPGLLAAERDTGGNFATVLDVFKNEAKYIDSMNDAEQMAFLNNILDYNEFGGKSIGVSKGIEATDAMKDFEKTRSELKKALDDLNTDKSEIGKSVEELNALAKNLKDETTKNKNKALEDLDTFLETGGQPLKKKDDKFLGGSMHEEGQLRTGIRQFLQTEYKNGRLKLDDLDKARVMEYSPMIEHDPILVFKKIYGDEAYKKAGEFPGAFEIGENFKHYEEIFRNNMGEDLLKVKDKKYVGDGKLVLTEMEEIKAPTPDDPDIPFATGGRASFAGGNLVSKFIALIVKKEPIEAMKEVNKVIGKKGKYKNLTQKDIDKIVADTEDHIFQRDPDNLYVYDDGKTIYDDDMSKKELIEKEGRKLDQEQFNKDVDEAGGMEKFLDDNPIGNTADDMSLEESLTTLEGLGATKMAERFKLKQKYPGITDSLLDDLINDPDPNNKARALAALDEAMTLQKAGKSEDQIIEILKSTPKKEMATGGRAGFAGGGAGKYQMDLPFGEPLFTMVMNNKLFGIYQNKDGSRLSVPLGSDGKPSYAKGGRAGFYMGGQSGQSVIEPDLSDIGHGSDALMSRTRLTSPGSQATTSTGLNYLLGEDNDNTRVPFRFGGKGPGKVLQDEKKLKQMVENFKINRAPFGILMDPPKNQSLSFENLNTADRPSEPEIKIGPYNPLSDINPFSKDNVVEFDDGTFMYKDNGKYFKIDEEDEPYEVSGPSKGAKIKPIEMEAAEGGRAGFNDGLLVPPAKPYTEDMFEKDSMTLLKGMYGTGPESNTFLYNKIIEKGNMLRKQGVERKTVIEIIRNNKDKINAFLETQTTSPKTFKGMADGGIAGLRPGYYGGGGVNLARRGFLKILGATAAGVAAFKTGALKLLGKTATTKVAPKFFTAEAGSGAPAWFEGMVNKVLADGVDITKKAATMDGQTVKSLDTPTGKVDVTIDRMGNVDVNYQGSNTAMGEGVDMRYVVNEGDELTRGKPMDEFEAVESIPEGRQTGQDDYSIEIGENTTDEVKNLFSDTSELAELGGKKELINDISVTLQKKKKLKQMQENPSDFVTDVQGDYDPT